MSTCMTLRPAPGRHVRRPDGRPLSIVGELVVVDPYWVRRLTDGDVLAEPPPNNEADEANADYGSNS